VAVVHTIKAVVEVVENSFRPPQTQLLEIATRLVLAAVVLLAALKVEQVYRLLLIIFRHLQAQVDTILTTQGLRVGVATLVLEELAVVVVVISAVAVAVLGKLATA
jgi:hypothetical protein